MIVAFLLPDTETQSDTNTDKYRAQNKLASDSQQYELLHMTRCLPLHRKDTVANVFTACIIISSEPVALVLALYLFLAGHVCRFWSDDRQTGWWNFVPHRTVRNLPFQNKVWFSILIFNFLMKTEINSIYKNVRQGSWYMLLKIKSALLV